MSKEPRYRVVYATESLFITRVIREFTDDEYVEAQQLAQEQNVVVEDLGIPAEPSADPRTELPILDEETIFIPSS